VRVAAGWYILSMLRDIVFSFAIVCALPGRAQQHVALADAAQRAAANSTLITAASPPFQLRAVVSETTKPDSNYRAEIEEYWVAPDKWRRTVKSPDFSQTIVVNGDKYFEQNNGDYFPQWLRELVTAVFEPLPMLEALKQTKREIAAPSGAAHSMSCARFESRIGTAQNQSSVFSTFCFSGNPIVVDSVVTPGYSVEFEDHRRFGKKQVAWRLTSEPEPGLNLQARITDLSLLLNPDESLFAVTEVTPQADRVNVVHVTDEGAKNFAAEAPAIRWPTVRSGKTSGVLSLYVGVDRKGQVREVWPLNSDNPALNDAARAQVRTWKFKPAAVQGAPVQVESILTIAFESIINDAVHVLTNEEARHLAEHVVEPRFKPGVVSKGTEITLRVSVAPDGIVRRTSNPNNLDSALFLAGVNAARQWKFRPYLREGKPDSFEANLTFRVQ